MVSSYIYFYCNIHCIKKSNYFFEYLVFILDKFYTLELNYTLIIFTIHKNNHTIKQIFYENKMYIYNLSGKIDKLYILKIVSIYLYTYILS